MHRYATIITDDDGHEVVSAIAIFEGVEPQARAGRIEPVVPGVLIGMVRGGPVDAIGGFGFPRGAHGANGRAISLARASLKAVPAQEAGAPATDAADSRKPARAKPARRKSRKAKPARARPVKQATGKAAPVGTSDHG